MADLTLRELARRAMASGAREDYLAYFKYLIRVGGNPLEICKRLAEMFGHVDDIDSYLQQVARSEETIEEFLAPLRRESINPEQLDADPQYELPAYFDYDFAKTLINDEIDRAQKRLARKRWDGRPFGKSHWAYPNYNVRQVLRVYVAYYQEEIEFDYIDNWQRGIIADVILDDETATTIWVEDWFAIPEAPDAIPHGNTVHRFDQPKWLWGQAGSLMRTIEATAPQFAKTALLSRLQAILDAGPYRD